jgi:hypothetical protein
MSKRDAIARDGAAPRDVSFESDESFGAASQRLRH